MEDDALILQVQESILAAQYPGVVFYTAVNGRLGLELFKEHMPDVVISDINMPEMSGVHMCSSIRAIRPDTKFIVITGGSGRFDLHRSDEKEFIFKHVIVKPVRFQELFAVVGQCISEVATAKTQARWEPAKKRGVQ